jgi:hypothetical protein
LDAKRCKNKFFEVWGQKKKCGLEEKAASSLI